MAYGKSYIDQYRKTSVTSASPLQLVVMLYDGAIRFMEAGKAAMADRDVFQQNQNIQRAQKIVAELMSCLDMEKGGEIAQNLFALYTFAYNKLVEGNMNDDAHCIDQAAQVLREVRESWVQLESSLRQPAAAAPHAA